MARITRVATEGASAAERFELDVHACLGRTPKALPSLYFYDARGSELFQRIMQLPEYYLTRAEEEIFEHHGPRIAAPFAHGSCDVVDLGAGDGAKTALLFARLRDAGARARYFPVDVSEQALTSALDTFAREFPGLEAEGVAARYAEGIAWLSGRDQTRQRLVLFLGSNVGNLDDAAAGRLFQDLRAALLPGDHLLVGFDLLKDPAVLTRAYDDREGVTREFNLNLLRRINRDLGADFQLARFRHFATFSPTRRAMESYLLSTRRQTVRVGTRSYELGAWEPIHTEMSRKYAEDDVSRFAAEAGFVEIAHFLDEQHRFLDALWRVDAPPGGSPE